MIDTRMGRQEADRGSSATSTAFNRGDGNNGSVISRQKTTAAKRSFVPVSCLVPPRVASRRIVADVDRLAIRRALYGTGTILYYSTGIRTVVRVLRSTGSLAPCVLFTDLPPKKEAFRMNYNTTRPALPFAIKHQTEANDWGYIILNTSIKNRIGLMTPIRHLFLIQHYFKEDLTF
jgi:hypothetical protein